MKRRRSVLRLGAFALLLATVSAAEARETGRTWPVTVFTDATGDSRDVGPPGSLRFVLARQARPGDTIVFTRPALVQLSRPLDVTHDRLRIVGRAGEGRAGLHDRSAVPHWRSGTSGAFGLFVYGDGVVIEGLTFSDVPLVVGSSDATPDRVVVRDNLFVSRHGILGVLHAKRVIVEGNEFSGSQDEALSLTSTGAVTVRRNTFTVAGKVAIDDSLSTRLTLVDNRFRGTRVHVASRSGRVADNVWEGGRGVALRVAPAAGQTGPLVVEGNTISNATVEIGPRGDLVRFARNRLDGSGRLHVLTCYDAPGGRLEVEANTVTRSSLQVNCLHDVPVSVARNSVTRGTGAGIRVERGERVTLAGNRLEENGGGGVAAFARTRVSITGGTVARNRGAGVTAFPGAHTSLDGVRMGGNSGPGIELAPAGVSPGAAPGAPKLTYDRRKGQVRGSACGGCRIELFESEDDLSKRGNAGHGEGTRSLGSTRASGSGAFAFPPKGALKCPKTGKVTATTTTREGTRTSEFARDVECSCVVGSEFRVERAPRAGFANYGITVAFPPGVKVGEVTLTDTATEKLPVATALGPLLQWELSQSATATTRDFFVQVSYRDPSSPGEAAPVSKVWRLGVAYDPPRGARECTARVTGVWRPVG